MHGPWSARNRVRIFSAALVATAWFGASATPTHAATTDNVTGWAWSASIGWISMNCANNSDKNVATDECATNDYGVMLRDKPGSPGVATLSGYAWSEAVGWICFGATCTSTPPEGGTSYAEFRTLNAGKADQFWGWAQVLSLKGDGWISLNCDKDNNAFDTCVANPPTVTQPSNYYVALDAATGAFGTGDPKDRWAWGNTNENVGIGWVSMSGVQTDWVLAHIGAVVRPQGIFEPTTAAPGSRLFDFPIRFPQLRASKGQYLECAMTLPDGSKRRLGQTFPVTVRAQPLPPALPTRFNYVVDPSDAVTQGITTTSCDAANAATVCGAAGRCDLSIGKCRYSDLWYLECVIADVANAAACNVSGTLTNDDATCGLPNVALCDEPLKKCRAVLQTTGGPKPIFTHANQWTNDGPLNDWYLAIKCSANFSGNYFKNAEVCDFAGNAAFADAMTKAVPIERNCEDGIDNDGNGQTDCGDRYCQGVSYRCQSRKRATCTWGDANDGGMKDCSDASYAKGTLCCTKQPRAENAALGHVVDGLECTYHDPNDGYFDCDCNAAKFGTNDCVAPGFQSPDLCCDAKNEVVKQ